LLLGGEETAGVAIVAYRDVWFDAIVHKVSGVVLVFPRIATASVCEVNGVFRERPQRFLQFLDSLLKALVVGFE
jgi:hypothetical protein